jgi:hypothetical protein
LPNSPELNVIYFKVMILGKRKFFEVRDDWIAD